MTIVAIIPSRFGSTRFEGKPLAMIAGRSMIQRVYENAAGCGTVNQVVVATDDRRIHDAVSEFGGRALMTAADLRSGTDRVAQAAQLLNLKPEDIVINIQGDQPLVDSRCFEQVTAPLTIDPDLAMSTLAIAMDDETVYRDPKDCKVVTDHEGHALYFSRAAIPCARDVGPAVSYCKHLGVYAYTRRFLEIFRNLPTGRLEALEKLEQLRALEYGHRIKVVFTRYDSPEVDLPEDIARIEAMIRSKQ